MTTRVNIKRYALHKRYLGLTCRESRVVAKYSRQLTGLTILHSSRQDGTERDDVEIVMLMIWKKYHERENCIQSTIRVLTQGHRQLFERRGSKFFPL
jgi:hypothetical protein